MSVTFSCCSITLSNSLIIGAKTVSLQLWFKIGNLLLSFHAKFVNAVEKPSLIVSLFRVSSAKGICNFFLTWELRLLSCNPFSLVLFFYMGSRHQGSCHGLAAISASPVSYTSIFMRLTCWCPAFRLCFIMKFGLLMGWRILLQNRELSDLFPGRCSCNFYFLRVYASSTLVLSWCFLLPSIKVLFVTFKKKRTLSTRSAVRKVYNQVHSGPSSVCFARVFVWCCPYNAHPIAICVRQGCFYF